MDISSCLQVKLSRLTKILARMGSVVIGFSGGVDSAVLGRVAQDTLGEKACAATIVSDFLPRREKKDAMRLAKEFGLRHKGIAVRMPRRCLNNPVDRCYYCKRYLFFRLKTIARHRGIPWVIDGSNIDDLKEARPGRKALKELGVRSPLKEAGMSKQDIRRLARIMGIDIWDKPACTCLATRIPFGRRITPEDLAMVEKAEQVLNRAGFFLSRVRHHQETARIEVPHRDIPRLLGTAPLIAKRLRAIGFSHVVVDLAGYRGLTAEKRLWKKKR